MVRGGLAWFGVVRGGLGWFGLVWGGLGWFGAVWGGSRPISPPNLTRHNGSGDEVARGRWLRQRPPIGPIPPQKPTRHNTQLNAIYQIKLRGGSYFV